MANKPAYSEDAYWSPICRLRSELQCWVRMVWKDGASVQESHWGMLLILPVKGYLEGPDGPIPVRDVERIEMSTNIAKGGMVGRPLQMIDIKEEMLAGLNETPAIWTLQDGSWSVGKIFRDEPVQLVRITNPFRSMKA